MCISSPKAQPLPPTPPAPATMADPAAQQARIDETRRASEGGLASTTLNVNLGGQGAGAKKLAGTGRP